MAIESMRSFRQKVIAGLVWSILGRVGGQTVTFGVGVVLARLLSPREFGLVGMIMVVMGFGGIFIELGLSSAIIQGQHIQQDHLSSVFWVNVGFGLLLMTIFMIGSPLLADFYNEPMLAPLTTVIATTFFLGSLSSVQRALLTKALEFRRLSIIGIVAMGVSGVLAITMAYSGLSVWSLAFHMIIGSLLNTILLWKSSGWCPSFQFRLSRIKELLRFSTNLLGTQAMNYWIRNIDSLLIGRLLGSSPLGIYSRAYSLMLFPLNNVSNVISTVMFPSLSIIQKDKSRVKAVYLQMTRAIALITFPIMCGVFVTAKAFVIAVLGQQWAEMIPILQVFSLSGMLQSIICLCSNLYMSQGRTGLMLKVMLFASPILIISIIIGLQWGILGVAISVVIGSSVCASPNLFFSGRLVDLSLREIVMSVSGIFLCSVVMSSFTWGLGLALPSDWPHWAYLAVQVPFGMIVYVVLIHSFRLKAYRELQEVFREQVKARLF